MFLGGAVLGTVTLAAAAWRSPLVPRIVPVFMLAFAVLDFAAGLGVVSHSEADGAGGCRTTKTDERRAANGSLFQPDRRVP